MMILPYLLWSDLIVWSMVTVAVILAIHVRRSPPQRAAWGRVGRSAAGMAAATVLAAFVVIGLLDSMHFREAAGTRDGKVVYGGELRSVLDALLSPLRDRRERTYSAPLATRAYAKETVQIDGVEQRIYPRLTYGGAHLRDESERWSDVSRRAAGGVLGAALVWFLLVMILCWGVARQANAGVVAAWRLLWSGQLPVEWRAIATAAGVIMLVAGPVCALAPHYHVLGTDKIGQDVLYQALKSIRTGLVIGTVATLVMLPVAVLLGLMAGYFKGWVDDLIQYCYTTLSSIPGVLLIVATVLMMQVFIENHAHWFTTVETRVDVRLLALCAVLGMTSWTGLCRLLRGEALKLRELEFVQAARAFGVSHWRILLRHLLPNVMPIVLIALVMDFSGLVLAEAVLSYVGVGVDPSTVSFGTMINAARLEMAREPMVWWALAAAFGFMLTLVLSANLFADAVRDAFDPRLRFAGGRS